MVDLVAGEIVKFDFSQNKSQYRVKADFNLKIVLEQFNVSYRYVEGSLLKDVSETFIENFIDYLVKRDVVEVIDAPARVVVLGVSLNYLTPSVQVSYTDITGNTFNGKVKLNLMNMQSGRYTSSCEWRVAPNQETV